MSFMPPEQIDNVWALMGIISDPAKAKAAIADMKKHSDDAQDAFQKARNAQQGLENERAALAKLRLSLDDQASRLETKQAALDKDIADKKKHFDTLLVNTAARDAELSVKESELNKAREAHRHTVQATIDKAARLDAREAALDARERKVQSILDDLGPLAAKLKL